MAKRTKKKKSVTCGKCGNTGHNARTCSAEAEPVLEEVAVAKVEKGPITVEETKAPEKLPPAPSPRARLAPTADTGTAATAAPYRCPKCNAVDILVIVKVKDHNESFKKGRDIYKGDTRCQSCMNKPNPAELILKWGARPDEKVSAVVANA